MRLAILGVTGAVGRTMLRVLDERGFQADELVALASPRSAGSRVQWRDREWTVAAPSPESFADCDLALFSAGAERSRQWAPVAAEHGAVVIDNSSAWRRDPDVPLVVPEVNGEATARRPKGIIANPNCSTIQVVVPLEGLRRAGGLRRVVACTFQSVSGAGQHGVDALRAERDGRAVDPPVFPARIDGGVIPQIGEEHEDGWTEEERKMRGESRRILGLPDLCVAATCVRVPVEIGHSVAVTAETLEPLDVEEASEAMGAMEDVTVVGRGRPLVPADAAGGDAILVGRVRIDPDVPNTIHFWVVADNLRKGAATNAVQIAERVVREGAARV